MFTNVHNRLALASMDSVLVIVVVCDPLSRFEKLVWLHHFCHPAREVLQIDDRCWHNISAAVGEPSLFERWQVGDALLNLHKSLGPRLLVIQQEALRYKQREAFGRIAGLLGAGPLSPETRLQRYNTMPGRRTGLCDNTSLVKELRGRLMSEYKALEELLPPLHW